MLEILFRGHTHWSMALAGGICFISLYSFYIRYKSMIIWAKCLISATIITSIEFVFGMIFNVALGMGVWNYHNLPGNIMGQVCPEFFLVWLAFSFPIVYISGAIEKRLKK